MRRFSVFLITTSAIGAAAPALAQAPSYVRANGQDKLDLSGGSAITGFATVCEAAGESCAVAGTMTMKVSAAEKKRIGLPSKTVAKGTFRKAGESYAVSLDASKQARKRLKKVAKVKVTYVMKVTSPVAETATKKVTLYADPARPKRVTISTSGDPIN